MSYLGSNEFRLWVYSQHTTDERAVTEQEKIMFRPEINDIIHRIAGVFCDPLLKTLCLIIFYQEINKCL